MFAPPALSQTLHSIMEANSHVDMRTYWHMYSQIRCEHMVRRLESHRINEIYVFDTCMKLRILYTPLSTTSSRSSWIDLQSGTKVVTHTASYIQIKETQEYGAIYLSNTLNKAHDCASRHQLAQFEINWHIFRPLLAKLFLSVYVRWLGHGGTRMSDFWPNSGDLWMWNENLWSLSSSVYIYRMVDVRLTSQISVRTKMSPKTHPFCEVFTHRVCMYEV